MPRRAHIQLRQRWTRPLRRSVDFSKESDTQTRINALHELFEEHIDAVYRHVHRRCGDHGLAEDVVQDVFVTIAGSDTDPNTVTVAWLKTVARNRMIDVLRRRENYNKKLTVLGASNTSLDLSDSLVDSQVLNDALDELLPIHRATLILHYVDGLTVSELGLSLGRTTKGAEGLITRARSALRAALEATNV